MTRRQLRLFLIGSALGFTVAVISAFFGRLGWDA